MPKPPPEAAPPVLIFRTWGVDLLNARYGMPPRRHGFATERLLRELSPVQVFNAHQGLAVAAMQSEVPADELRLIMVRMSRLNLELAERLLKAGGKPYHRRVDETPLEPWMIDGKA